MSEPVRFEVSCADPATEVFLIDGDFRLVERGVGRQIFSVPPGIYKVKTRSGRVSAERVLVVRPGMPAVTLDPLPLDSPMPLLAATRTHEFHMAEAARAALDPAVPMGQGSGVVLVARRWSAPSPTPGAPPLPHPAHGVSLRDAQGNLLIELEKQPASHRDFDPCVALHLALDPGAYRLALPLADERVVEQSIIAIPGWETHIFLLADASSPPDPINSAITWRRPGDAFHQADARLRNEEMLRKAVQEDRRILSPAIRGMITDPGAPPMLALLGAHLLLRETTRAAGGGPSERDQEELGQVVGNLRSVLGPRHPDVEAIALAVGRGNPDAGFETPPMLRPSWPLILNASVERPQSIPPDSPAARAAERIWGEGPWLHWLAGAGDTVDRAALWQARARELVANMPQDIGAASDFRNLPGRRPGSEVTFGAGPRRRAKKSPGVAGTLWQAISGIGTAAYRRARVLVTPRVRTPFPEIRSGAIPAEPAPSLPSAALASRLSAAQRKELVTRLGIPLGQLNAWIEQNQQ